MSEDRGYLNQFGEGNVERTFHEELLYVIRGIGFPLSRASGFALMRFLDSFHVVTEALDTRTNPLAGSASENAILVAHVFSAIEPDPEEWRERFSAMAWNDFDSRLVRMWRDGFRASKRVRELMGGGGLALDG